jgi:hypothetical protein
VDYEAVSKAADRIKGYAALELGKIEGAEGHPFIIVVFDHVKEDDLIAGTKCCLRANVDGEMASMLMAYLAGVVRENLDKEATKQQDSSL